MLPKSKYKPPERPSGRMPQAPASLMVQLPPDQLKNIAEAVPHSHTSATATLALQQHVLKTAYPSSNDANSKEERISDVALLAASIKERREHEARVFIWQQRLIGGIAVDRTMLKRALTQFSLPAWLQVLQERHLAQRCAYPTCDKAPKRPHISQTQTVLPSDTPRYRISLRRRAIERDERDDAGGEHGYCSKACWRRGEWVSRWVLNNGESSRKAHRDVRNESFGSRLRDSNGLGTEVNEGGRWERFMQEDHWTEVELLEDLEDKGDVERLPDDDQRKRDDITKATVSALPPIITEMDTSPDTIASPPSALSVPPQDLLQTKPIQMAQEKSKRRRAKEGTTESFLEMIGSLEIHERSSGPQEGQEKQIIRAAPPPLVQEDSADIQMSLEEGGNDSERERQQKEEDTLFDQAWAAMAEEKSKGLWDN